MLKKHTLHDLRNSRDGRQYEYRCELVAKSGGLLHVRLLRARPLGADLVELAAHVEHFRVRLLRVHFGAPVLRDQVALTLSRELCSALLHAQLVGGALQLRLQLLQLQYKATNFIYVTLRVYTNTL